MTAIGIEITFVIGILILVGGAVTKKKWVVLISIIPLVIALSQIIILILIGLTGFIS